MARRRRRNVKRSRFDRCVGDVSRSGSAFNPYAVCASKLKPRRRRRSNRAGYLRQAKDRRRKRNLTSRGSHGRLYSLIARKANHAPVVFTGTKFARSGKPALLPSLIAAKAIARALHRKYPALRSYSIWAREV
jgi:hypothetical protein